MKIRDLIAMDTDIDVCDDYDESCWIAMCGPIKLTEQGEKEFADVLDLGCEILSNGFGGGPVALLECGEDDDEAAVNAEACKKFFFSAAGYCGTSAWDRWFKEN